MPRRLGIQGEQHITKSDQFLELEALLRRIVFIEGCYISFEFAHIALRAQAEITILHRGQRLLEGFDPDLANQLVNRPKRLGARIEVGMEVMVVEKSDGKLLVHASTADTRSMFEADLVVQGAGRVPELDDSNLAAAGVQAEERGVEVNEYLQSISNPAVYAAGDAASSGLPPVAGYEGKLWHRTSGTVITEKSSI